MHSAQSVAPKRLSCDHHNFLFRPAVSPPHPPESIPLIHPKALHLQVKFLLPNHHLLLQILLPLFLILPIPLFLILVLLIPVLQLSFLLHLYFSVLHCLHIELQVPLTRFPLFPAPLEIYST